MHLDGELRRQPRLAHPGLARYQHQPARTAARPAPVLAQPIQLRITTRQQGLGTELGRQLGRFLRRHSQRRVLRQNRPFQLTQPLARLDPQLLDQCPAPVLVGLQRVGLPVAAVQGEHQLCPKALAVGVLGDQRLELADHVGVPAERELGLDQLLERHHAQIFEPGDLGLRESLVREVGQRRAPPERERPLERRNGALRATGCQLAAPLGDQPLEPVRVQGLRVKLQLVATLTRDEKVSGGTAVLTGERPAQTRDARVHRLGSTPRGALTPQLVDQPIGTERLVGMQQQQPEQRPLLDAPKRNRPAIIENFKRAQDADIHARGAAAHGPTYRSRGPVDKARRRPVTAPSPRCHRYRARSLPTNTSGRATSGRPGQEEVMGQAIPTQHPAVVLRSHYNHLRALLAAALIALVGLTVAIVILATDNNGASTSSAPAATAADFRLPSHARMHGGAPVPDLRVAAQTDRSAQVAPPPSSIAQSADMEYGDLRVKNPTPGTRYDGGPNEGTRGLRAEPAQPGTRYDGGPDEGTRGPAR